MSETSTNEDELDVPYHAIPIYYPQRRALEYVTEDIATVRCEIDRNFSILVDMENRDRIVGTSIDGIVDLGEMGGHQSEITRLRSLLEDLVRAVEPFATDAMFLNGIAGSCPLRVPEYVDVEDHELGSTIGDLSRLREAYLKAKGETNGT